MPDLRERQGFILHVGGLVSEYVEHLVALEAQFLAEKTVIPAISVAAHS